MNELQQKITKLIAEYHCTCSYLIQNRTTGEKIEQDSLRRYPSASMIKVPIMAEVMRQAATQTLSLDEKLPVSADYRVGGSGILTEMRPDLTMSIRDLVMLMIILSDNTATNMLIDRVGMNAVNETMTSLGLTSTLLQRRMMDFTAAEAGKENYTSASDLAKLFSLIADGGWLPAFYHELMLDILKKQQVQDKLPFYLPEETPLAHKTGTLPGVEHDGGILFLPDSSYIICIMMENLAFNYEGMRLGARLGKVIYDEFTA